MRAFLATVQLLLVATTVSSLSNVAPSWGAETYDTNLRYRDPNGVFTQERQALHEKIIEMFLEHGTSSSRPDLIFSAGPFGAGKGYTMDRLREAEFIDRGKYLVIDPDKIKELLPEYDEFLKADPIHGASKVHEESGYIQELLLARALKLKKNIIVDGSLRGHGYYTPLIRKIRTELPMYSTAIYAVEASENVTIQRIQERAKREGRNIDVEYAREVYRDVQESVSRLKGEVDAAVFFSNEDHPRFIRFDGEIHGRPHTMKFKDLPVDVLRDPNKLGAFLAAADEQITVIDPQRKSTPFDGKKSVAERNRRDFIEFLSRYADQIADPVQSLDLMIHSENALVRHAAQELLLRTYTNRSGKPERQASIRQYFLRVLREEPNPMIRRDAARAITTLDDGPSKPFRVAVEALAKTERRLMVREAYEESFWFLRSKGEAERTLGASIHQCVIQGTK